MVAQGQLAHRDFPHLDAWRDRTRGHFATMGDEIGDVPEQCAAGETPDGCPASVGHDDDSSFALEIGLVDEAMVPVRLVSRSEEPPSPMTYHAVGETLPNRTAERGSARENRARLTGMLVYGSNAPAGRDTMPSTR